jgi:hypothetical protein
MRELMWRCNDCGKVIDLADKVGNFRGYRIVGKICPVAIDADNTELISSNDEEFSLCKICLCKRLKIAIIVERG